MKSEYSQKNTSNKYKKLSWCPILIILFILCSFSTKVNAADNDFIIRDGILIKYIGDDKSVLIPDTVTEIAEDAFYSNTAIECITFPKSVTKIGSYSFYDCTGIRQLNLGDSIISIGNFAFAGCANLKGINGSKRLAEIGWGAFDNTLWLADQQEVNPLVIMNHILIDASRCSGKVIIPESVKTIGKNAFFNNTDITKVMMPDSVTKINKSAFSLCVNLKSINLPKSIKIIEKSAFSYCKSLRRIILPKKLSMIEASVFYGCSSLKDITIPEAVTSIGALAFDHTPWLEYQRMENPLVIINHILIDATNCVGKVTVPTTVTEIGDYAFSNSFVKEVNLPQSVIKIGSYAFSNGILKKINFSQGLKEIGSYSFYGTKIRRLHLPDSIITIRDYAFNDCDLLRSIYIPSGVERIGEQSFAYCNNVLNIYIPNTLTEIGKNAFVRDNSLVNLFIDSDNPNYSSEDTYLFNKDKTILISCLSQEGKITLPKGVQIVKESAFYDINATQIIFPSALKELEDNVFVECTSLKKIMLPSSMDSFGNQKFTGCQTLKSIQVYPTNRKVNFISKSGSLYSADEGTLFCNPSFHNIIVPDTVTTIGNYAFPFARDSIFIPAGVTTIGEDIFVSVQDNRLYDNDTPLFVYGYTGTMVDSYCKSIISGVAFLAYDVVYSITYELDGGLNNPINPSNYTYRPDEIILYPPVKEGYRFLYWYESISLDGTGYNIAENRYQSIPPYNLGNITLTAKWEPLSS